MKGQSAIEYLMTYGWMLLVVAIVGGAVFSVVQGQCNTSVSGITGDITAEDIGLTTDDDVQIRIRNAASAPVVIESISVEQRNVDSGSVQYSDWYDSEEERTIEVGSGKNFEMDNFGSTSAAGGCNEFEIDIVYSISGGLQDQVQEGIMTLQASIN